MPIRTTALKRASRMHDLAKRSTLLEATQAIEVALEALAEVDDAGGTRKALEVERDKLRAMLGELPTYRPPERGQGEAVNEELADRVRVARAETEVEE